jgi:hypothetical protein
VQTEHVLVYDGDPIVIEPDEGLWVPVTRTGPPSSFVEEAVVQPEGSPWDVAPGAWEPGGQQGIVFIANLTPLDLDLDPGAVVAGILGVTSEVMDCGRCGARDCLAWELPEEKEPSPVPDVPRRCASCGDPGVTHHVGHVVEEPGGIDRLAEVETPTEYYYSALRKDMGERYGDVDPHVLDHLLSVEAFLDKSILSGFSFGVEKAQILVTEGKLLGHWLSRSGSRPDGERVQGIWDFAPLKEKVHIQQFLGCCNWLRWYLPAEYGQAAKALGEYGKVGVVFPREAWDRARPRATGRCRRSS